jgi:ankyrin repeat protein
MQFAFYALERGAEVYAKRGDIGKALVAAVQNQKDEIVRILLSSGADLAFQNYNLDTALQEALKWSGSLWSGTEAIVPLLLRYGADPRTRISGRRDVNLLSYAMQEGPHLTMELLESNVDCFDLDGKDGQALLTWAIEKSHSDVESCLLRKRVKMDVKASEML